MAIRSVTSGHPCPICGKGDWCGIMCAEFGDEMFVCQRNTDSLSPYKEGVIGVNGKYYLCVGVSKEGQNNIFRDAECVQAEDAVKKKEWRQNATFKKAAAYVPKTLTPVDPVETLDNTSLDKIYRSMLDKLILEPAHREYLRSEGWSDELIDANGIKSFPEEDYIRFRNKDSGYYSKNPWRKSLAKMLVDEFGTLRGVPGAYLNKKGEWTFNGQSGILFPLYDTFHHIYRLRVRLDNVSKKGGKYRNFSSFKLDEEAEKQGFLVNVLHGGCQAGNNLGFYMNPSRDDMYIAYVTEGEKKGIIGEDILHAPFISVPGVSSYGKLIEGSAGNRPIDRLKELGIKVLIIAFDADKATNEKVMQSQERTVNLLRKEGFIMGLAEWDISYGKGIDDLLFNGKKPRYVLA